MQQCLKELKIKPKVCSYNWVLVAKLIISTGDWHTWHPEKWSRISLASKPSTRVPGFSSVSPQRAQALVELQTHYYNAWEPADLVVIKHRGICGSTRTCFFSPFALIHSAHRQQQLCLLLSPFVEYHLVLDESINTQYAMFHIKWNLPFAFLTFTKLQCTRWFWYDPGKRFRKMLFTLSERKKHKPTTELIFLLYLHDADGQLDNSCLFSRVFVFWSGTCKFNSSS